MELRIDKSDWVRTRLGDVCTWYQRDIPNDAQEECGIEFYVTANHIDGGEVRFNRYDSLSDGQKGPTITKHFEEGDLLLSTRSVALRKAAIAPVSGVTGEKLLVLRTSVDSDLISDLMPFVFQSDDFWNYAQNSVSGSVNKFTSWTKIREYEFLLPPKDEQAEIAELLWALDESIERGIQARNEAQRTYQTAVDRNFTINEFKHPMSRVGDFCQINQNSLGKKTPPDFLFEYLDLSAISGPHEIGEMETIRFSEAPSRARRVLDDDSIVISLVRPYQLKNVFVSKGENIISSTGTAVISSSFCQRYLYHQFFSNRFHQFVKDRMTGTSYPAVKPADIADFQLVIPSDIEAKRVAQDLDSLLSVDQSFKARESASRDLQSAMINYFIDGV